jgi:hypothetical protein
MSDDGIAFVLINFCDQARVTLTAFDVVAPADPENGDMEFYRWSAIDRVARQIRRERPGVGVFIGEAPT